MHGRQALLLTVHGMDMRKKSAKAAFGGVFSALCVTLMFFTGLVPFATYAFPMLAGAMLVPIMAELGRGAAAMVYISVSLLSVFVVPDREAVVVFVAFFGYYPIAKGVLEKLPSRVLEYTFKIALFNAALAGSFSLAVYVLGMAEILRGIGDFGRYAAIFFLLAGNAVFIAYDIALTNYYTSYVKWFKPRFLRRQ